MTKGFNYNNIAIKAFKHGRGVEALAAVFLRFNGLIIL
jgi:hypothetical protein